MVIGGSPSGESCKRQEVARFRLVPGGGGIIQGVLRYVEKDESLSYCVLPGEVQTALNWAHDGHGHFATEITE